MGRRGDINATGEFGEVGDELLARCAGRRIAGKKRKVAATRDGRADNGQRRRIARKIGVVDERRAEIDFARCAMTDDRDRRQICQMVGLEERDDLVEPIAMAVDDESLLVGLQSGKQIPDIGNARIDKDDLLTHTTPTHTHYARPVRVAAFFPR